MKKRLLSMLLCLAMLLTMIPSFGIAAQAEEVEWNLRWDGDCVVWDPVEGADYYSLHVFQDGTERLSVGMMYVTSYDVKGTFRSFGPGTYTFEVVVHFADKNMATSPLSQGKVYVPPVVDLGEPSNAVWDGTTARWDEAQYAEKYFITLYKVGVKEPIDNGIVWGTSWNYGNRLELSGSGSYYFEVQSFREFNFKGPAVSGTMEYTAKIPKVQNAHWDGYTAKWDPVKNAGGYGIVVYEGSDYVYGVTIYPEETSLDLTPILDGYGCGKYTFDVAVLMDGDYGGVSDPSEALDYHTNLKKLPKKDPTCTETGLTAGSKCDACGKTLNPQKTIDKLPHTYDASWVCTVCGDEHTHALGKKHGVKAATDTANGNIEYYDCVGFGDGCDLKLDAEGNELTNVTIPAAKTIKLSSTSCTYNGEVRTPTVTVKAGSKTLVKGTDYTVTYASGRKAVGTYKVVVKGKGDYAFTKTLTFKIIPAKTAISKLTAAQKTFTVKWAKKSAQVGGYQIQYSLKKDFSSGNKLVTVKGMNNVSKTIKNLLAGKTYFVRVRTFKTVDGKNYTSAWSAVKSIKTLK